MLITSQEIDELCEKDNITQARRQMDGVLIDLRRGVRVLADHGIKTIVLVADHGHLFADEISEDMKIEAPGGETADLHRRVWVGVGGTSEPSYLRMPLSALGMDSEYRHRHSVDLRLLQVQGRSPSLFPRWLVSSRVDHPGGHDVTHGPSQAGPPTGIEWTLTPGTPKLTTRFFSVQIAGQPERRKSVRNGASESADRNPGQREMCVSPGQCFLRI